MSFQFSGLPYGFQSLPESLRDALKFARAALLLLLQIPPMRPAVRFHGLELTRPEN